MKKEKVSEKDFPPPEEQFIERVRNNTDQIDESEIKSLRSLNKYFFQAMFPDYIYGLNFPKDCKLEEIDYFSLNSPDSISHYYSIKFPPSLKEIKENALKKCIYLKQIIFLKNDDDNNSLEIIGDKAFTNTIIESITMPENIKEIGSQCFPCSLNTISFEKGAPKLEKLGDRTFSNTNIETFSMPLNIKPFVDAKCVFFKSKRLKSIIFDGYIQNETVFESNDESEELEERNESKSQFREFIQKIESSDINDERLSNYLLENLGERKSRDFAKSAMLSQTKIESLSVFASNLNHFYFYNTPRLNDISVVEKEGCMYARHDGCLYSNDMKKLIVAERNIKEAKIDSKCEIIMNYAFNIECLEKVSFEKNSELQEISLFAFAESCIKSVSIPETVNLIDYGAFFKCTKLEKVNIPPSLEILSAVTFAHTNLTEITIPKTVRVIEYGCFYKCAQLSKVVFENDSNLIEIHTNAFAETSIESISIPKSVRRIDNFCFMNCTKLKSIQFESDSQLRIIGRECFKGTLIKDFEKIEEFDCSSSEAENVSIPGSSRVKLIDFYSNQITQISIPPRFEIILSFMECPNLTTVKIINIEQSKLTKIWSNAFLNCSSLTEFNLPGTVKSFGSCCFRNCINYKTQIKISNDSSIFVGTSAFENSGIISFLSKSASTTVKKNSFKDCPNLIQFSAHTSSEVYIENNAFENCSALTTVKLSQNTANAFIGESCFENSALKTFDVPNHLRKIPNSCFKCCQNLTSVNIHEESDIETFGDEAFYESKIKSIYIPANTQLIGKNCFEQCKDLKKINFSENIERCIFSYKSFASSGIKELKLPFKTKIIDVNCFQNCSNLKSVEINCWRDFEKIDDYVFESSGVEQVIFGENIEIIGKRTFANCKKLKTITFSAKEVTIQPFAFAGCVHLQELNFTTINLYFDDELFIKFTKEQMSKELLSAVFANTELFFKDFNTFDKKYAFVFDEKLNLNDQMNLTLQLRFVEKKGSCYYTKQKTKLLCCDSTTESINVAKKTEIIKSHAFQYTNLKKINFERGSRLSKIKDFSFENLLIEEIVIPDSVTFIGSYAFRYCYKLKKVTIKKASHLETIEESAFEKTQIETILFPETLRIVGDNAFFECTNLKTVNNLSKKISFGYEAFAKTPIEKIKFPSEANFNYGAFSECVNLKQLTFLETPTKVIFGENSFAFSGLEEVKLKCECEVHRSAFCFCNSLKRIHIMGDNILCFGSSFYNSNINACVISISNLNNQLLKEEAKFNYNVDDFGNLHQLDENEIAKLSYMDDLLMTNIEKCSITLSFSEDKIYELFLNHKCYVSDNLLFYADLIDNCSLFEQASQEDLKKEGIKKNEILRIPSRAKTLDFPVMSHIKKIIWGKNCIVEEFGVPRLFAYNNLVEITIPKLITSIPNRSFEHCHFLKVINFEKESKLEIIGEFAFADTSIEKIVFPENVSEIKKSAFANTKNLKEVHFNGLVIGMDAFSSSGVTYFELGNKTTKIGSRAFQYCRSLTQFKIDIDESNLSYLGNYAFAESGIESVNIPPLIKVIRRGVFSGCDKLKTVNVSTNSKLDKIKDICFAGDLSLEKINIPKTINEISFDSFVNTPLLQSIMDESSSKYKVMEDKSVYVNDNSLFFVPRNQKQFQIAENCPIIHSSSFCGPILEEVTFSDDSLTKVEKFAFAHSTGLKEIKIPASTMFIEEDAFIQCENLENVEFANDCQIKQIPMFCFAFSGMKSIILPSSVEIIDHSSFFLCKNLKAINLHETQVKYICSYAFAQTNIEEIKFPPSTKFIANHAFDGCKSIQLIDFTEVKEIEEVRQFPNELKNIFQQYRFPRQNEGESKENEKMLDPLKSLNALIDNQQKPIVSVPPKIATNKSANVIIKTTAPQIFKPQVSAVNTTNKSSIKGSNSLFSSMTSKLPDLPEQKEEEAQQSKEEEIIKENQQSSPSQFDLIYPCFIHDFSFCNAVVKIFKFKLECYKWFDFFNSCKQIEQYIVNDSVVLNLQKLAKEKPQRNRFIGSLFNINQITWEKEETIPLFRHFDHSVTLEMTPFHFLDCSQLTSVTIDDNVAINEIPKNTFAYSLLNGISIPSSVQIISKYAFKCCSFLEKFVIPDGSQLSKIGTAAFSECVNLTSFTIPGNVKLIPTRCFYGTGLEQIEIPSSVKKINSFAFYGCKKLNQVILNNGIIKLGVFSFANNESLKSIDIPDSLKTIKSFAFSYCVNLSAVNTTEETQLVEIFNGSFENTQIEEIGVNLHAKKLFEPRRVPKLNKIIFYKGKPTNFVQTDDGTIYDKTSKLYGFLQSDLNILELKTLIKDDILNDNSNSTIKEICLQIALNRNHSEKQHSVLNLVFAPKNLDCLKIHEDCFSINNSVLDDMENLATIEYTKGLSNAIINFPNYNHLFAGQYNSLTHIKITGEFAFMEEKVFAHFDSLEEVEFGETTDILCIPKHSFLGCKNLCKIVIPSSCLVFEEGSFKDCNSLQSFSFRTGTKSELVSIGKEAFKNCSSLESVSIPSSVHIISDESFMNCTNLAKVEFESESALKKIGKNAFKNCSSLSNFILPQACKSIGVASFMNCTGLSSFEYKGNDLKSIPCRAFINCSSLSRFELQNVHYETENWMFTIDDEAFMNCTSLKEVVIEDDSKQNETATSKDFKYPPLVKNHKSQTVKKNAFSNCKSLEKASFILGNLQCFDEGAFANCCSLKEIEINSIFWKFLLTENLHLSAFTGTPDDLEIKIYSNTQIIEVFKLPIGKEIKNNCKKLFKEHLSSLNQSFIEWNVPDEEIDSLSKKRIRSTVLDLFGNFKQTLERKTKKNFNTSKRDYSDYRTDLPLYVGHSDPLQNVRPIHLKSRHEFNDIDRLIIRVKDPPAKSRDEIYRDHLSKLDRSFLEWRTTSEEEQKEEANENENENKEVIKDKKTLNEANNDIS